ncbi:hypothetical protein [Aliarcobacter skirrowii]|uniref:Uncharacterized protein n=1 Tax=Aliarcobacter skirrowii TaxID=28200 RepID=A0AAW9D7G0_9BACT|nr:hypothetical protein [Aliarcobacter skirrowii]MDX4068135.1 hypothetical protein [Aliarcobacter skirrowii]
MYAGVELGSASNTTELVLESYYGISDSAVWIITIKILNLLLEKVQEMTGTLNYTYLK